MLSCEQKDTKRRETRLGKGLDVSGWTYYNHAAIPSCAPHETPPLAPLEDGSIWVGGSSCIIAMGELLV